LGVKLTDDEIANSLIIKLVMAISSCANAVTQSIRHDVSLIWTEFLQQYLTFGVNLKTLMKKRRWFKYPPFYYAPGLPFH
jgi:hypothetical protein